MRTSQTPPRCGACDCHVLGDWDAHVASAEHRAAVIAFASANPHQLAALASELESVLQFTGESNVE